MKTWAPEDDLPLVALHSSTSYSSEEDMQLEISHIQCEKINIGLKESASTPVKFTLATPIPEASPQVVTRLKGKYEQFIETETKRFIAATCPGQSENSDRLVMKPVFLNMCKRMQWN